MKTLAIALALAGLLAADAAARTWTSSRGRTIEAEFVGLERDAVLLKKADNGVVYPVALAQLSKADRLHAYDMAIRKYSDQLAANARDADAYNGRGLAHKHLGEYDKALDDFGRAIRNDPQHGPAYRNRGDLLTELDQGGRAMERKYPETYRQLTRRDIGSPRVGTSPLRQLAQADYAKAKENGGYDRSPRKVTGTASSDTYSPVRPAKKPSADPSGQDDAPAAKENETQAVAQSPGKKDGPGESAGEGQAESPGPSGGSDGPSGGSDGKYTGEEGSEKAAAGGGTTTVVDRGGTTTVVEDGDDVVVRRRRVVDGDADTVIRRTVGGDTVVIDDDHDVVIRDRATTYLDDALALVDRGDYVTAIDRYSKAIDVVPDDHRFYISRANTYRLAGNYDRAIVDYDHAIKLQPKSAEYYYNRGLAHRHAGALGKALADYTTAIELDPGMSIAYTNRAGVYGVQGDYRGAIDDATKAIRLNDRDPLAYFNRGVAYLKSDQAAAAVADLTVVLDLTPRDAFAHAFRARAYDQLGQDDKAAADRAQAAKLNPALAE